MAKYLLAYTGGVMAPSEEERQAVMQAWGEWFEKLGPSIADPGNPFGPSATVTGSGVSDGGSSGLTGYTLLNADDLAGASELAKGCPVLGAGGTVEVYETFEVM